MLLGWLASGLLVTWFGGAPTSSATPHPEAGGRVLEIRSYNLKPGARGEFHRLVLTTLPLLQAHGIEVVGFGPSLHDTTTYYLVRAFTDLTERARQEEAFYGSREWREGRREQVLALIENYTTLVLPDTFLNEPRRGTSRTEGPCSPPTPGEARATVERLNRDYLRAAGSHDWGWYRDHLSDSVVVVLGSGRRVGKSGFLKLVRDNSSVPTTYGLRNVTLRAFGLVVQADADAPWERSDGTRGVSRYIDTYAWIDCRWQVISAQITLLPPG